MALAQFTILSNIHPGNGNWIEVVGVVLLILASVISPLFQMTTKQDKQ